MPPFLHITQHSPPMFALHSIPASHPILTPEDHALLALIVEARFTLPHIVANYESAHPARQSLLTLTRWLKLPHIDSALKVLLADLREYESIRHEFLQRHSIDGLVDAMHSASRNLKLLEEARTHNIQHTRAVEELRPAAQALNRATKPDKSPSSPRSPKSPSPRSTAPSSDQRDSGSSSLPRPQGERELPGGADCPAAGWAVQPLESTPKNPSALCADEIIPLPSTNPSSHQCEFTSALHREAVEVNRRGSWRSHTPGEDPQNTSTRSLDALTSDNILYSTDPSLAHRDSASPSPRSGARNEPGASAPGTETSHITLPSSFLSTEGAPHSTRSPDALTCDITPPGAKCLVPSALSSSPSTPRHLDTSTPSSIRARDRP